MMVLKKEVTLVLLAFLLFIFLTYIPGLIFYPFFSERYNTYFSYSGAAWESLIFVFLLFSVVFFLLNGFLGKMPRLKLPNFSKKFSSWFFIIVSFLFLIFSFYFFIKFSISFRHKNRLSDAGVVIIALFFLKYLILVYTYLCFSMLTRGASLNKCCKFTLVIMLIGWILSLNSSLQVVYVFIVLVMLLKPDMYNRVEDFRFRKLFSYSAVVFSCLFLVLFIGIGNKVGIAYLFTDEGIDFLTSYGSTVAARGSTSLYSLAMAYDTYFLKPEISFHLISLEFYTFLNRAALYIPFGQFNPDMIDTVSRFNYMLSFANHADRAGGTPGFLATVIYAGGLPLGFIVMSFYLFFIVRLMSRPLIGIRRLRLLNIAVMCYFILPLMENPLSTINLLNPASFYFVFFFFVVHFFEPNKFLTNQGVVK